MGYKARTIDTDRTEELETFNNALENISRLFFRKDPAIQPLKKGFFVIDDEYISKLFFVYFVYGKFVIGFQQSWNKRDYVPFLEVVIAIHLNENDIPFRIYEE